MKVLKDNITKCKCGSVLEYDDNDIISAIVCPECGGLIAVDKPQEQSGEMVLQDQPCITDLSRYSWDTIHEIIETKGASVFRLGATKEIELTNGEKYLLQVTDRKKGLMLSFLDLYGTNENGGKAINENEDYERSYADSDLRRWLNEDFYALLPDDLKKYIVPCEIVSEKSKLKDTVFIPSEIEVFGKQEYGKHKEGEQLELYADYHSRITGYADGQYSRWYWLRTKAKASAYFFCFVDYRGIANYNGAANNSSGVRPHFLIK